MLHCRMLTAMYSAELAQLSASPVVVASALWSGGAGSKMPEAWKQRLGSRPSMAASREPPLTE